MALPALPLALVLLAACVRLPTLAQQSFWLDEAYTERLVHMSLGAMLHAIPSSESTPPVYYVLAWLWTRIFGYSELGIRSLSAVAGILTVPAAYGIARRLAGRTAATIAALLVALAPLLVWFSQEARSYALATFLSTLTVLCLVAYLQGGPRRWLVGWGISAALGLATHYFVGFIVAAEVGWLLWGHLRRREVVLALACVLLVMIGLTPLALAQHGTGHADYIAHGGLSTRLLQVPKQFLVGYSSPLQALTASLAAVLAGVGAVHLLIAQRKRPDPHVLMVLATGVGCVVMPVVLALVGIDFLDTRNLLPALVPLLIVVALGFAGARRRASILLTAGLSTIFVGVVVLVDTTPRYQRDDWRSVSRALGAPTAPRAVVVSPPSGSIPLGIYQPRLRALTGAAAVSEIDLVAIALHLPGGGGIGPAPRPPGKLAAPLGFRLADVSFADTYTVIRFRSRTPTPETANELSRLHLGTASVDVLVQSAPLKR